MEISTKYNAGDRVFFLNDGGRIEDSIIKSVRVIQTVGSIEEGGAVTDVSYQLTAWKVNGTRRVNKHEDELYPSMEALIDFITTDYEGRKK